MKSTIIILMLYSGMIFSQELPAKGVKDGWAIHVGFGNFYGGNIGLTGERQILLKEKFRISPYLACGIAEAGEDSSFQQRYWLGFATGANFELGKKHRLIFGPQFLFNKLLGNSNTIFKDPMPYYCFMLGYKGTADFGLIWQVYIGDVYSQDPTTESTKYSHSSQVGIGLGFKF